MTSSRKYRRAKNSKEALVKIQECAGEKGKLDLLLRRAAYHDDLLTAKLALENGADPNSQNRLSESAWSNACEKGSIEMVRLFLKHGASLEADRFGIPPLIHAIRSCREDVAEELIKVGADLNERENTALQTPLHEAAIRPQCLNTLNALLDAGADPRMLDCAGEDALTHAKSFAKQFGDVDPRAFKILKSALKQWEGKPLPKKPRRKPKSEERKLAEKVFQEKV